MTYSVIARKLHWISTKGDLVSRRQFDWIARNENKMFHSQNVNIPALFRASENLIFALTRPSIDNIETSLMAFPFNRNFNHQLRLLIYDYDDQRLSWLRSDYFIAIEDRIFGRSWIILLAVYRRLTATCIMNGSASRIAGRIARAACNTQNLRRVSRDL